MMCSVVLIYVVLRCIVLCWDEFSCVVVFWLCVDVAGLMCCVAL